MGFHPGENILAGDSGLSEAERFLVTGERNGQ